MPLLQLLFFKIYQVFTPFQIKVLCNLVYRRISQEIYYWKSQQASFLFIVFSSSSFTFPGHTFGLALRRIPLQRGASLEELGPSFQESS